MTTTVDQKGSVPLPDEVMRSNNLHPGDKLEVMIDDDNIILRKVTVSAEESLLDILRSLKGLPMPERERSSVRDVPL
jgi:AbrB family looped-hinge helix DNA binding protein